VLDEPRPTPNSMRPSLRWSIIATRSATQAGVPAGVMLKIPDQVDAVGHAGEVGEERLVRREVRVLGEEVVLRRPRT
jgi:hypothetical protein